MGTIIVGIGLALGVGCIIKSMVHDKKNGRSLQCGGECKYCGGHCHHE